MPELRLGNMLEPSSVQPSGMRRTYNNAKDLPRLCIERRTHLAGVDVSYQAPTVTAQTHASYCWIEVEDGRSTLSTHNIWGRSLPDACTLPLHTVL